MRDPAQAFTHQLLSYGQGIGDVKAAADAAPRDALLNAYAAAAELFAMTGAAAAAAGPYLARAVASAREPDDQLLVAAISAWARGDLQKAIEFHRARLASRPDDLAAAKICQLHHLDCGDAEGLVETVRLILPANERNHYVLGQYAFALEQVGDLGGSEVAAKRALDLVEADDPWTHHAVAHCFYSRGRLDEGIASIADQSDLWERSNAFMYTHAWWHAAIAHIDADRPAAAMDIYDDYLLKACPNCVQSLVNAVSLLARLTLRGTDVGDRWCAIVDRLARRAEDRVNGFLDLHYLYGLALAGRHREAAIMLSALANTAAGDGAKGLIAHANGHVAEAAGYLRKAHDRFRLLGGSHEQRDLFELVELDAALRALRQDQAGGILEARIRARPAVAWHHRTLATVRGAA